MEHLCIWKRCLPFLHPDSSEHREPLAACKSRDAEQPDRPRQSSPPSTAPPKPPDLCELLIFCTIPWKPTSPTQSEDNSWKAKGVQFPEAFMIQKEHFPFVYTDRNDEDKRMDWEVVSWDRPFSPAVTSEFGTFYTVRLHQRKSPFPSHPISTALPSGCWKDQTPACGTWNFNHHPAKLSHFHKMLLISPKFWYNLFKNRKTNNHQQKK